MFCEKARCAALQYAVLLLLPRGCVVEIAAFLIDFILHIDKHLQAFVVAYGPWVYALLFSILFCRNRGGGHAVFARRFAAVYCGGPCWRGLMDFSLAMVVLLVAAILGDQCNYTIGRMIGPKVFQWEDSRWFNRRGV